MTDLEQELREVGGDGAITLKVRLEQASLTCEHRLRQVVEPHSYKELNAQALALTAALTILNTLEGT